MKKTFLFVSALIMISTAALFADDVHESPFIRVTGQGEAKAKPDRVTVSFGISTNSKLIKQAQDENAKRTDALIKSLKNAGIAEKNIQTSYVQINPRYDYVNGRQQFAEYIAVKNFTVQMNDLNSYGKVIQAALDAGVTQMSGIDFESSKRKDLEEEAIKSAVLDAQRQAEALASAAGRKRGEALQIELGGSFESPMPMFRAKAMAMDAAGVPDQIAAGEITVKQTVNIKYKLQ